MPYLKFIAQNINQKEYRLLRGKAIECISLIGMCVPRERVSDFSSDRSDFFKEFSKRESSSEVLLLIWESPERSLVMETLEKSVLRKNLFVISESVAWGCLARMTEVSHTKKLRRLHFDIFSAVFPRCR
jgi:hypothetical protein